ncbi:MAG: SufD family Fe-S cluster assembly protein, partial [Alphaproteobacteria bacterium]|nr:SufD family Fe-S cluster assembly protein [Alphaproteobacteria bacterium]
LIAPTASANTLPRIIHNGENNHQSHEATTGTIDAATLNYLNMAGIETDTATALIIGAVASPVLSRLPMEFLVESKQLIKMALSKD